MIIHDPKKAAVMIIAHSEPQDPQKEENDEIVGICEDIIHAVKTNDVHALAMALKAFHAECQGYESEE